MSYALLDVFVGLHILVDSDFKPENQFTLLF